MIGKLRFKMPFLGSNFTEPPHDPAPVFSRDPAPADDDGSDPGLGEPDLFALASQLEDGAACSPELLDALQAKIAFRRRKTDTTGGPTSPQTSDLTVRRSGLPEWWEANENVLLAGEEAKIPDLRPNAYFGGPFRMVLVVGARTGFNHANIGGEGGLIVIGDDVLARNVVISCTGVSTVLMGERTRATNWAQIDCRNGGIVVVGQDGMWAHDINFMTDDTHAIRDLETGKRLNGFGGRIVIDRHVWLCEHVRVLGGARIGPDTVVGMDTFVKNADLAPNSVYVGAPARLVRSGVTWSPVDAP
jgi:acetyltransferase-like isoleucine patch superfamily enzyme